jgi:hypothetical protein
MPALMAAVSHHSRELGKPTNAADVATAYLISADWILPITFRISDAAQGYQFNARSQQVSRRDRIQ